MRLVAVGLAAAVRAAGTTGSSPGYVPTLTPSQNGLPGTGVLLGLANGLGFWALIAAIVGIVIGGVVWAFGHYSGNFQQSYNGRKGVMVAGLAALLIGGASQIVRFFVAQGAKF
jgi:MFS family permease